MSASYVGTGQPSQATKLAALDAMVPQSRGQLVEALLEITTPLRGEVWEQKLAEHPDRQLANYVTYGIFHGFRVVHSKPLRSRPSNMKSALEHPDVVSAYLAQERALNRMAVVHPEDMPHIHCHISPLGVISKKAKPLAPYSRPLIS